MIPPLVHETDDRFCLQPSTIPGAGLGCFARVPLLTGDRLEVIGILIEPGSAADRCTTYADEYKFRVDGQLLIPCGYAGMVNHAAEPNVRKMEEQGRLFLEAIRDIAAGEELFFMYSDYAQKRFLKGGLRPPNPTKA
jgi:hypothetical protein